MNKGIILSGNFLNQVIFKIDFTGVLKILDENNPLEIFIEKISEKFPNMKQVPRNKFNLDIDINSGLPKKFSSEGELAFVFKSEDNKKQFTLTSKELILNYKKGAYIKFHDFLEDILLLIDSLEVFKPIELKFLGLRYINQINNPIINNNIETYIDESLSRNIIIDNLNSDEELIQIFSKLNIKNGDYLLTLQYGFFNPKFPNPNDKKEFILDYECITHKIKNLDEIKEHLIKMNKIIFIKFDNAVTQEFAEFMQ